MTAVRLMVPLCLLVFGLGRAAAEDRTLTPGETFKDCDDCPTMAVIPPSDFMMGAPELSSENDKPDDLILPSDHPFARDLGERR